MNHPLFNEKKKQASTTFASDNEPNPEEINWSDSIPTRKLGRPRSKLIITMSFAGQK